MQTGGVVTWSPHLVREVTPTLRARGVQGQFQSQSTGWHRVWPCDSCTQAGRAG